MKLSDVFSQLAFGKLSNLSMCESGDGTIAIRYHPKITNAVNEGLLRLYSRFTLWEKELTLELAEHITNYHLSSRFAESRQPQPDVNFAYIKDLHCEPFQDDVIKVLSVYAYDGSPIPLNDEHLIGSVFTPQMHVLQAFPQYSGVFINLHYQAKHPELVYSDKDAQIHLPDFLKPALLSYVAYMVYSDMNTQESVGRAQEHMAVYDSICTEAEMRGIISTSAINTNTRFHKRGWL